MRRLIEEARNALRRKYSPGQVLLIEAPTGYGKSVSVPLLAAELYEEGFAYNLIHVLPLRTIVEDLYTRTYLGALEPGAGGPLKLVREAFGRMGVGSEDIAYQMGMDVLLRERGGRKSPSFDARVVVSTLDSFAYNLLRLPVSESFKAAKRYAKVRARIFTSAVFMDEAHIVLRYPEEEDAGRMLAFMKVLVEYAQRAETPLVVMSATVGSWFKQKLWEWSGGGLRALSLGERDAVSGSEIKVRDPGYEEEAESIEWRTTVIGEDELAAKARELAESGLRVLVVRNRVKDAVEMFKALRESVECALLHGQLTARDRGEALARIGSMLKAKKGFVAVATPVVEAGVNWDFDAAFVEAANAFSMVQVVGRVCRDLKGRRRESREGLVYVVKVEGARAELVEWLGKALSGGYIDWRLPFDYERGGREAYGYHHLIELMSWQLSGLKEDDAALDAYERLALAPFPPSRHLRDIEESMSYSVLREPLTQIFVGLLDSIENIEAVLARAVSYDLSLAKRLWERAKERMKGFVCVGWGEDGQVHVELYPQAPQPEPSKYVRRYKALVKRFVEEKGVYPVAAGYLVEEEAYEQGVGFRV
jgi:CRISPR-associated endonuclease/helicase Cas3